jgi:hypothetical protein
MTFHALVLLLTAPRQVGEWSLAVRAHRIGIHEPHDLDVFRPGGTHEDQEEGEGGDGERAYVHRDVLSYSMSLFEASPPLP